MLAALMLALAGTTGLLHAQTAAASVGQLRENFAHPPADCRIMVRWWWFGPAVTEAELKLELEQMKADGIGGVEIASLYPLALNDESTGFHNASYVSEEHLQKLAFAAAEARKLGLRVDITLGSGWPFGGPHIPVDQAAGELRVATVPITAQLSSLAVPYLAQGEKLLAVFFVPGTGAELSWKDAKPAALPAGPRLQLPGDLAHPSSAVFFNSSRTGMTVKRPAVGAEGFVLDHYDHTAIDHHLQAVGDRLISPFGNQPPYAVFSDSLEVYGSDWTAHLLSEFQKRRGYDLTPYLPALIDDIGPDTAAVRHDWGKTLTELADEQYLQPLRNWAHQHHTQFRSQSYGIPPVNLWSNRYADLPEGEGKATTSMWRQFSDTRWAASASHLLGKPVTSSETWTWLHSPAFRATPLDMKAEADLHFLQGINQLIGHGWPYSPPSAGEPGWRMYAATALNDHNPWHFVMPDVTAYLQRVSYALRLGKPANQVALLLPDDDAWAGFHADKEDPASVTSAGGFESSAAKVSMDESESALLGTRVVPQILDAGFNVDFIDADAIDAVGIPYPILVLPSVDRLPLATYRKIEDYARHGGIVVATRSLPSTAPGLRGAEAETAQIRELSRTLFHQPGAPGHFVQDDGQLGASLAGYLQPDVVLTPATPEIGAIHRKLPDGDLYFVANTSNQPHRFTAKFRSAAHHAEWWDPFTGSATPVEDAASVSFDLQPYESRILFFSDMVNSPRRETAKHVGKVSTIELTDNWQLGFGDANPAMHPAQLHSWSDDPEHTYYSGQAAYEKTFDLPPVKNVANRSILLDFGPGTPVPPAPPTQQFNMRAYLESPVREAAEVFVNGQRAGSIWHPPFSLDITPFVRTGANTLRIVVGNTAINEMAGKALPDYRLLNDRYGERFTPQGMENLHPLPSGILHAPKLVITTSR